MFRRTQVSLFVLGVLATIAAASGCGRGTAPIRPQLSGFGAVTLQLTDAPATYDHINLDVREVWVHRLDDGTAGDTLCRRDDPHGHDGDHSDTGGHHDMLGTRDSTEHRDGDDHERDDHGMWHRLDANPGVYDLLDLRNGVFRTLASGRVPAGLYDQVRLKLGPNNSIVVDGSEHPLKVPSGQTAGYKLFGRFDVPVEGAVDIGIDLDAARSVHRTGSDMWILHPVARIHPIALTGSIRGAVDPAAATTWAYAMQGPDTVTSTQSGASGEFTLALLPEGDYSVRLVPAVSGYRDTTIGSVSVTAGSITELGTIALPVEPSAAVVTSR